MSHPQVSQRIIELLTKHHLLTAPTLLEHLAHSGAKVNKTSVYRALDKLQNQGLICQHNFAGHDIAYELRDHHHDHAVCDNCGKIESVKCQLATPPQTKDIRVTHHHVTLYGTCHTCAA